MEQETVKAFEKIPKGVIDRQAHELGIRRQEPLIIAMDGLIRYAKAYRKWADQSLAGDGILGRAWLDAALGIRILLNGQGAVAMELNITTDSKSNGAVEEMFWKAIEIAGFKEEDF